MKSNSTLYRQRRYQSVAGGYGHQIPRAEDDNRSVSRPKTKKGAIRFHVDLPMILIFSTLIIFGLLMVFSASYDYSFNWYGNPSTIFIRQLIWMGLGLVGMLVLTFIDYHILGRYAVWAMAGTIFLLIAVLVANEVRNGASRTIYQGSVQPSELAKLVLVIYLSVWLTSRREQLGELGFGLVPLALILGLLGGLIIIQPDLSAVVTILALGGLMFFLAGGDLRQIGVLLLTTLLFGALVVQFHDTGRGRVRDYLSGLKDPTEGSYHVRRSLEAFESGGWLGVGIGNATGKVTGLPVPPTDSIFAVVGEETGVVGGVALVGLYGLFFYRGIKIARRAPDQMGALLVAGLVTWICLEAFINMSVLVNILPFAGNALPFISAGGSNLLVSMAAVGLILNVSRVSVRKKKREGSFSMRLLICAGGTGGGVYPALAILNALQNEPEFQPQETSDYPEDVLSVLWVGSVGGMEEELVKRAGLEFEAIPAAGVHGVSIKSLPGNILRLARGHRASVQILRHYQPHAMLFTGGYVAVPMALAGRRFPSLVYVPDIEPGLALQVMARFADHIAVTTEESRGYFSNRSEILVSGYPTRPGLDAVPKNKALYEFHLTRDLPVLMVTGGSSGAQTINNALYKVLPKLLSEMQIIHLTGRQNWAENEMEIARIKELTGENPGLLERYKAFPYLHSEMGAALSAADLVVARAGASVLGEFPLFGLPAILVPYPYAWRYQKVNADFLAIRNAAIVLPDEELPQKLASCVLELIRDQAKRDQMCKAMRSVARPQAAGDIAHSLIDVARQKRMKGYRP